MTTKDNKVYSIDVCTVKQVKEKSVLYDFDITRVLRPADAVKIINQAFDVTSESVEVFGVLALDTKNNISGLHILSRGTINTSLVHPREVYKSLLLNNAVSYVCFHNHPTGDTLNIVS